MVGTDFVEVDRRLRAGELCCPGCAGSLAPWGHARERIVRAGDGVVERVRPRRACCTSCGSTHVLLPASVLLRRADAAAVIGVALTAKAAGLGHRPIAARLGRACSTVRGWLRAFAARAEQIRAVFTRVLVELDPLTGPLSPTGAVFGDAVEAVGAVAAAARRRLGVVGGSSPWQLASAVTGGRLLMPSGRLEWINTSSPWAAAC
jgi:hypothetical protein